MSELDRRTFLKRSAGALSAMAILPELAWAADAVRGGISVGIVGMGRQGRAIAGELQKIEGVRITAVCDVDEGRLRSGARRVAGAATYGTHWEMLDQAELSAVFVATPTHLHRQVVEDALDAGKHVYCEAPLAATVEEAQAIAAAARAAKTVCVPGLLARSNPIYQLARSFFLSDAGRELAALRAQHHEKSTWRTPASDPAREKALNWRLDPEVSIGLPGELGTHQFEVFHYFRDRYPTWVQGWGGVHVHRDGREVADTAACVLGYDDEIILQYGATLVNSYEGAYEVFAGSYAAIKLAWTHGWMFKEPDAPLQGWEVYANRQQFHNDEGITLIADATKLAAQGQLQAGVGLPHPPLYYGVADFLKSVTEDAAPVTSIDEGMRATIVGIAANEALTSGQRVEIDPATLKGA